FVKNATQEDALAGFSAGIFVMIAVVSSNLFGWTWFTLIGVIVTIIVGWINSKLNFDIAE
ncbi:MAG: hypothetical protein D6830_01330, partial [Ignavibacteria bacterium]